MTKTDSLQEQLDTALVTAMKARDGVRLSTLRMVRSALKNKQIEKRRELTDADVLEVLGSQAKQRREAIEQFRAGRREDLARKEEAELEVLQEFLPRELSEEELQRAVRAAVAEVGAETPQDMGKVMAVLMPRLRGQADGAVVNRLVRESLAGEAGD